MFSLSLTSPPTGCTCRHRREAGVAKEEQLKAEAEKHAVEGLLLEANLQLMEVREQMVRQQANVVRPGS